MGTPKYKRILLKLSGEALAEKNGILNFEFISSVAEVIKKCLNDGVQVGVIVGAGNIWRGRQGGTMNRARADQMGMLATTINALALQDTFIQSGIDTVVMTPIEMNHFAEPYTIRGAIQALENGKVVVDPVMGDGGNLYAGFSQDYVNEMRLLCKRADFILPNVTEACYLAQTPFPLTKEDIPQTLERLREICPVPIITGVIENDEMSVYYTNESGEVFSFTHENVKGFFHGAGDVFSSAFVGCLAKGKTIPDAIALASAFTSNACRRSANEVSDKRFGLNFEAEIFGFLQKLNT